MRRLGTSVALMCVFTFAAWAEESKEDAVVLKAGKLEGRVANAGDGKALSGMEVILNDAKTGKEVVRSTTDEKGGFAIAAVAAGSYSLLVGGKALGNITVAREGHTAYLTILMPDDGQSGAAPEDEEGDGGRKFAGYDWSTYAIVGGGVVLTAIPLGIAISDLSDANVSP